MRITLLSFLVLLFCVGTSYSQIAHWPLDGNTQEIIDGKHAVASPTGVSWVDNDPQRGQVLQLDGMTGYVTLPSVIWESETDTNTTITCWFNWAGGANWQRVYSLGLGDPAWKLMYLCPRDGWDANGLHLTFHAFEPDQWYDFVGEWGNMAWDTITPDKWYFSAVILKEDSLKVWLNDSLIVATDSVFVTPQKIQAGDTSNNVLGMSHWPDTVYNGMIDDFRIYGDALSDAEVLALFYEGNTGTEDVKPESPIKLFSRYGKIMYADVDESQVSEVSVYSITGALLFRSTQLSELPSRSYKPGIYLVNVRHQQEMISRKIAVMK
jgi:hypothetical protein